MAVRVIAWYVRYLGLIVATLLGYQIILSSMQSPSTASLRLLLAISLQLLGIRMILPLTSGGMKVIAYIICATIPITAAYFKLNSTWHNHLTMEMLILVSNVAQTAALILVLGVWLAACNSRRRRTASYTRVMRLFWICLFVLLSTTVYLEGLTAQRKTFVGLFGITHDICRGKMPIPWLAMLPRRTLNFFMGPESCPMVYFKSAVGIKSGRAVLDLVCEAMHGTIEAHNRTLLASYRSRDFSFIIPSGIENILVNCGSETRRHIFYNRQFEARKEVLPHQKDVLVIILDAVGRPFFHRELPLTRAALEAASGNVFQFLGYHIIGHSTTANTLPLLTGYKDAKNANKHPNHQLPIALREEGYLTTLLLGACFDYITNPFETRHVGTENGGPPGGWDIGDAWELFCLPEYPESDGNFAGPYSIHRRCSTDTYIHDFVFNYVETMWMKEPDRRKFVMASLMDGHEGTQQVLHVVDKSLAALLDNPLFADTVIILMSDHGHHMGPYFEWTMGGRMEHLMPMFHVILPVDMMQQNPALEKTLRHHDTTTITPYDIYRTMAHLADFPTNRTLGRVMPPTNTSCSIVDIPWGRKVWEERAVTQPFHGTIVW